MFLHALTVLVGYMAVASSREMPRPMPTITNSLVNLGKMEIAFYFTDSPSHAMKPEHGPPSRSSFFPKLETVNEEPCPCSSLRNAKDSFLSNPASLFTKLLANNDLFSFNNDPVRSSLCCDSHEHVVHEGSMYFELSPPNQKPVLPSPLRTNPPPMMPFVFDSIIPNKSMLPSNPKAKAIELFLFPKKKDIVGSFDMAKFMSKKKDTVPKEGITVVGEKKLENNINLFKVPPPVKKDLSAQEKNIKETENDKPAEEGDTIIIESPSKPNAV